MAMATTATKALHGGAAAARKILAAGSPRLHPSASSPPTTPQVISRGFSSFRAEEYVKMEDLARMNNRIQLLETSLETQKAVTRAEMLKMKAEVLEHDMIMLRSVGLGAGLGVGLALLTFIAWVKIKY
ncbi:uncharacterized protein [Lolium perenne]|uniref:uncharacterized protein n=1 Tax=Lolium perenne TaxID=4522 RepID=UPI0021F69370|nr:uncharacterized protein LOC127333816 [Lolium perenne]